MDQNAIPPAPLVEFGGDGDGLETADPFGAAEDGTPKAANSRPQLSLAGLTVGGLTRRRAAWIVGALASVWIVLVFARQVGDAAAVSAQADQARVGNAAVAANVASLQQELALVQRPDYILQQARGLGLGTAKEHAVELAPNAPALPSDAPGSASLRLGAPASNPSPLESWLDLLFGPTPGG